MAEDLHTTIDLELDSKLKRAKIIEHFVFNAQINSVVLTLNHAYNGRKVICPLNIKQWIRSSKKLAEALQAKGVTNQDHIFMITDTVDSNIDRILQFGDEYEKLAVGSEYGEEERQQEAIEDTLMDMYYFRTMKDTKEIYYYNEGNGIYSNGAEIIIESEAESMTDGKISTAHVNESMNHIRRRTYTDRSGFDVREPHILNLQNGLLNIDTLEIMEHSPDQLSLVQLPVKYDPAAKCPKILRFLGQVLHPQDVFAALQIIGYCLYKSAEYEKAIMLAGSGSNGKSVFLKLIEALVGAENTSHIALQDLDKDRFAAAGLYCKMVNTFADLKQLKLTSSGNFKMLVSGDSIRAQNKFKDPFSFRNYAKLIFSANKIPESEDQTYAYYRRWLILEFEKVFDEADRDTKLIDKLATPEELSGLLNLALIGLKKLRNDNGFKDISVEKVRKKYEEKSNTVKAFLDSDCMIDISDPLCDVLTTDMYAAYCKFCKDNNERSVDMSVFGKQLAQFGIERKQIKRNGDKSYYYLGVKLKYDFRALDGNGNSANKKNETLV
jgi:putative DNA primase/helicase